MAAELYVRRAKRSFDYIFCDPPFPYRFKWQLVAGIAASVLAREGTLILLHRPREDFFDGEIAFIRKLNPREFGRSVVEFLRVEKNSGANVAES
jgi:16S rRNA G966 N2-methylase RsmD